MDYTHSENILAEFLQHVMLERLEKNIYRGRLLDLGYVAAHGGEILAQALSAACQTVPNNKTVHSFHSYFFRAGNPKRDFLHVVERVTEGKSFSSRRVRVVQKGLDICSLVASFHIEEPGFEHQDSPPEVSGPDGIESDLERSRRLADQLPEEWRDYSLRKKPIEIRQVDPDDPSNACKKQPVKYNWVRTSSRMPDNEASHKCLLTYASDFYLGGVSQQPHGAGWAQGMKVVSLDHAVWFHRDFRMDDWLLYAMSSPGSSGGRGMNVGKFYTREGVLVASVAQECLMRRP